MAEINIEKTEGDVNNIEQNNNVIKNDVIIEKPSVIKTATTNFTNRDLPKIKNYIVKDVIQTTGKKLLSEMIINIVKMALGQQVTSTHTQQTPSMYHNMGMGNAYGNVPYVYGNPATNNSVYKYDTIVFQTQHDAQVVKANLVANINTIGVARLADYYILSRVPHQHTDNNFGWRNLDNAIIYSTAQGWKIKLSPPNPI